ncbi:BrnT family toxin [Pontiella sulfatireligans]|uniref:Toxin n=1 Tax=Pontiella sulfatireligans TaxID=2750658 RepID=A0A6C2USQ0_9BACT|nr:BrnT family toxin [Pontiella sulfatireligans]VGO23345.1 hypothetical protein SCARR_05452 [Pontiella sulfatireligans]
MTFEFDPLKSAANKQKHGIDFVEAQQLWGDGDLVELPSRDPKEERYLMIGMMEDRHWTAIVTYRSENIRIISVRRARVKEVEIYDR